MYNRGVFRSNVYDCALLFSPAKCLKMRRLWASRFAVLINFQASVALFMMALVISKADGLRSLETAFLELFAAREFQNTAPEVQRGRGGQAELIVLNAGSG